MRKKIADTITSTIIKNPAIVAIALTVVTLLSVIATLRLNINYSQIELLPQDLTSVKATRDILENVGGMSNFILALKSKDTDQMKKVADDIVAELIKDPEIIDISYKSDYSFIEKNIGYYIKTDDLDEIYSRLRKKIRSEINKDNPFSLGLSKPGEEADEPLDFSDIVAKYEKANKKAIDDPYIIDKSKEMILIMIRPKGDPNDLGFTRSFIAKLDKVISGYNSNNPYKAVIKEGYGKFQQDATITYGYAGDFKSILDDSDTVNKALAPTAIFAFIGIMLYLMLVLRKFSIVVMLMTVLSATIFMTYAFCKVTVGELNTVTSILGAILMGFGIDFGLYFIYRVREEFTKSRDLPKSIDITIRQAGSSSAISALISGSSFLILMVSDFKGFIHFGLMAGTGLFISMITMYTALPAIFLLLDRVWPAFKDRLVLEHMPLEGHEIIHKPFLFSKRIISVSAVITVVLIFFAFRVSFDFDARSFMSADSPSLILQEEIAARFDIPCDPSVIFVDNLEDVKAIHDKLSELPEDTTIDSVLSLYTLVPSGEQQAANREILDRILEKLKLIKPEMLAKEDAENLSRIQPYLEAKPFTMKDVPRHLIDEFRTGKNAKKSGYLIYIYPKVSIFDSKALIKFSEEVGTIQVNGKSYHTAGMAVLSADLATIVLKDGKRFLVLALVVIFVILLAAFRSFISVVYPSIPLVIGMIWMLGLMDIFGWKINFINMVVLPVVFGYGISSGVYIYRRYLESGSVMIAVKYTGMALIGSSVTTLIGWASLLISGHRGLVSMGMLALFGISAAMIISLTLMPALLQFVENLRKHEKKD